MPDIWISRELTIAAEIPISVDHGNIDAVLEKMTNVLEAVANHVTSPSKEGSLNLIVASRIVQRHAKFLLHPGLIEQGRFILGGK